MKIVFYASDKPRELMIAKAFAGGALIHGDTLEIRRTAEYGENEFGDECRFTGPTDDTDLVCVFGAKGKSRRIIDDHKLVGKAALYFDKGYTRNKGEAGHTEYSRITINGADPSKYMMKMPGVDAKRFGRLDLKMHKRREINGGHVLFCGSSQKYCDFNSLGNMDEYASGVFAHVRKNTLRQLIYRPKPADKRARPIGGCGYSSAAQRLEDALRGCHVVITHGATAAMDAVLAGVPAIALGGCIASPVCGNNVEAIEEPYWPKDEYRLKWAHAMAYCQWTNAEMRSGEAWSHLKATLRGMS